MPDPADDLLARMSAGSDELAAPSPTVRERLDAMHKRFVEASRRAEIVALVNAAGSEGELTASFVDELCEVFDAEVGFLVELCSDGAHRVLKSTGLGADEEELLLRADELQAVSGSGARGVDDGSARTASQDAPGGQKRPGRRVPAR